MSTTFVGSLKRGCHRREIEKSVFGRKVITGSHQEEVVGLLLHQSEIFF